MDYRRALEEGELEPVLAAWHRGGETRRRLIKLLAPQAIRWGERLVAGPEESRRLAAALLGAWPGAPEPALELLHALAADPDGRTRELAARASG